MNNENIIKLYAVYTNDPKYYYQIFDYCNGGDLSTLLKAKGRIPE